MDLQRIRAVTFSSLKKQLKLVDEENSMAIIIPIYQQGIQQSDS